MSEQSRILKIQSLAQGGYEHLVSEAIASNTSIDVFGMDLFAEMNREPVTIAEDQVLDAWSVLTQAYEATATADAGNTGNGTVTNLAVGLDAVAGNYTLTCTEVRANRGIFELRGPNAGIIGEANVQTPFESRHLNFTLADGSTDFAVGDSFVIEVEGPEYAGFDFANAESQIATGVLALPVDTSDGALEQFAIVRGPAVLPVNKIILSGWATYWPTIVPSITSSEAQALYRGYITQCIAQLQRRGIVVRD